ncbi:hypothetical protein Cs7R123_63010 [Catellatospora sp. TT07R-123]|uniref:FHA domain-containing protein n=1 Tax=Catellatospora sp. TT07R-123 TaxID=2733863 RepID=UPI001B298351|nr:FHA domain-containing protein [Catellatospora sp. TT07R-123]GHJ48959.1 hypothetical protein Cs7R123_63010 [Catellatospora sp. TT07R-123]
MTADDEERYCRLGRRTYRGLVFCPEHSGEELVAVPAAAKEAGGDPEPADPARQRTACWSCGAQAVDATNRTCAACHEPLVPPALAIDFPGGRVEVRQRGTSAELGRGGTYGHVFARHRNVSRWHATVSVDEHGTAWLTPNPGAPNGTFVNGCEIFVRTPITPDDRIRFATDQGPDPGPVSASIRLPQRDVP